MAAEAEQVTVPKSAGYYRLFLPSTAPETSKAAESPAAHRGAGGVGWQRTKAAHPEVAIAVGTSLPGTRDTREETSLLKQISS